jgi:TetR/AcrR family acrAB operon transcriptional repressor
MRKTKAEAARTRQDLIDGALRCFDRQGIAGTTLDDIARAARVTKGALYWHFTGKAEILKALRDAVSLPIFDRMDDTLLHEGCEDPLERIEGFLAALLRSMEKDREVRTALSVMHFKCEYAGELESQLEGARNNMRRLVAGFAKAYGEARRKKLLAAGLTPRAAAAETMMFMSGLLRLWLLDSTSKGIRRDARSAIRAHVSSKRAAKGVRTAAAAA